MVWKFGLLMGLGFRGTGFGIFGPRGEEARMSIEVHSSNSKVFRAWGFQCLVGFAPVIPATQPRTSNPEP